MNEFTDCSLCLEGTIQLPWGTSPPLLKGLACWNHPYLLRNLSTQGEWLLVVERTLGIKEAVRDERSPGYGGFINKLAFRTVAKPPDSRWQLHRHTKRS